jgi:hypothetical protein
LSGNEPDYHRHFVCEWQWHKKLQMCEALVIDSTQLDDSHVAYDLGVLYRLLPGFIDNKKEQGELKCIVSLPAEVIY